jgi:oligoendopeptidase F
MSNSEKAIFFQNIQEKLTKFSTLLLFFTLQINNIEEEKLNELLQDPILNTYKPWFRDLRVFKKYQLSDKEEEILHQVSITSNQAWQRLFDETCVDLRFPFKDQVLSASEALHKLSDPEPENRKIAAKSIGRVFGDNIKLFTLITNTLAKDKQIEDNLRKFPQPISSRNLSNYIEDEVVEALVDTVKSYYPKLSHRYYKLKAKWLGKKQLDYWDRNAPLPGELKQIYSWEEAVNIVLAAYQTFSPQLAEIAKSFFDNNWIDVPVKHGKRSGAFAHPTVPSSHPYLMLNYLGNTRDVMTLAHELGHGVHQLMARKQGVLMCGTPLTLAETASVFGEQLTFRYLLENEKDEKNRKILIANKVEDMLNTVVRQIAFCEFERALHDERKKGELSSEKICDIWLNVQKDSLGEGIKFDEEYKYYWAYIPHFIHSPFYVYSYAFGDCLVNSLYQAYLQGVDGFEKKYFAMLEAGGTKWHKELLAPFGLDASKKEFWGKGLDMIAKFIDQLE